MSALFVSDKEMSGRSISAESHTQENCVQNYFCAEPVSLPNECGGWYFQAVEMAVFTKVLCLGRGDGGGGVGLGQRSSQRVK